jgi:hypothetical protein
VNGDGLDRALAADRTNDAGKRRLCVRSDFLSSGQTVVTASVCLMVLAYLAWFRRERFLVYWAAAWAVLVTRQCWSIFIGTPPAAEWQVVVGSVLRLLFGGFLLAGVEETYGRRVSPWVVVPACFVYDALVVLFVDPFSPSLGRLVVVGGMCLAILVAAVRLAQDRQLPLLERRLVAASLAAYALSAAVSVSVADSGTVFRTSTLVAQATSLLTGFGMLAIYYRRLYDEDIARRMRVDSSLTRALGEFLPICMHCKAIREGDHWEPIEGYVRARTAAKFSHGVCPQCAAKHYSEFLDPS